MTCAEHATERSKKDIFGAFLREVKEGSPADDAGFTPGCVVTAVDGHPLRDMIDWAWYADDLCIKVSYIDTDNDRGEVVLERDIYEEWGFVFDGAVFDGVKTCRNSCTFCFMRQMPDGVRDSLVLRDDDFRLSFLDGNFVTLTNIDAQDEARIIEQHISPLRMSLHAISADIRRELIGKNERKGIEVCMRLLDAGIKMHMQIVLVPGVNDGEELIRTLSWAYTHENVLGVGVVPLGFTKHQRSFRRSFNDAKDAQAIMVVIEKFQQRALAERGNPWVFVSDEFYRNAYPHTLLDELPPTEHYGEFDMFEDGIGIIRSTVDSWRESARLVRTLAEALRQENMRIHYVIGYAQREFLISLVQQSPLDGLFVPFLVRNDYFGGNVDVTGLLCGCDIVRSINEALSAGESMELVAIPDVIFNSNGLTLDDMSLGDIQNAVTVPLAVVSCNPAQYLNEITELVQ